MKLKGNKMVHFLWWWPKCYKALTLAVPLPENQIPSLSHSQMVRSSDQLSSPRPPLAVHQTPHQALPSNTFVGPAISRMTITIDPDNIREIDTIDFNLLAEDVVTALTNCITQLCGVLTRDGVQCGECMTTNEDAHHPVVKINIRCSFEEQAWLEISILIHKANCHTLAFKAQGEWRMCSDCAFHVIGARTVDVSLSFGTFNVDFIGPGSVFKSLNNLTTGDKEKWENGLHYLVFIFVESAKFIEVFTCVTNTFQKGSTNIYEHQESPAAIAAACPKYWGKISKAFCRYFRPMNGVPSIWKLSARAIQDLNIPTVLLQKATAAEIHQNILSQIRKCEEMTYLIMRGLRG